LEQTATAFKVRTKCTRIGVVDHVDMATPELTPDYLFFSNWMPSTIFHWISKIGRGPKQERIFCYFDGGVD
jgi:hypothetical protein